MKKMDKDEADELKNHEILMSKDMLYYLFDWVHDQHDAETMWSFSQVCSRWRFLIMDKNTKYFTNYWTVANQVVSSRARSQELQDSILDLLLTRLEIAPFRNDIMGLVRESELLRVSSLEDLNMPLCLDELVPDDTPGGNGQIYVCNSEAVMRRTIESILEWMRDYLHVDLFPKLGDIDIRADFHVDIHIWDPIETGLDVFYYSMINLADADVKSWQEEYERYTNDTAQGSHKVTNVLNKIKIIHSFLDILSI